MGHDGHMTGSARPPRSTTPLRLILVVALCTLLGLPVVAALAASPVPSAQTQPDEPEGSAHPGNGKDHGLGWGWGNTMGLGHGHGKDGARGDSGRGGITITAIDDSRISLTTEDGWTRTIVVAPDTTITKAGLTIKPTDLAVGDSIAFHQKRNADGTYTITVISVRIPTAGGEVTAVTASSVTVKSRDGTSRTIKVNGATTYQVGKVAGTKADVTVGSRIEAEGSLSGDTFTATRIRVEPARVGGEVTAKTSSTITVKGRDGKTQTIHVSSATTYKVRGKDVATLADIAVGDLLLATGTTRSDGSLDASQVLAGTFKLGKPGKHDAPGASATP